MFIFVTLILLFYNITLKDKTLPTLLTTSMHLCIFESMYLLHFLQGMLFVPDFGWRHHLALVVLWRHYVALDFSTILRLRITVVLNDILSRFSLVVEWHHSCALVAGWGHYFDFCCCVTLLLSWSYLTILSLFYLAFEWRHYFSFVVEWRQYFTLVVEVVTSLRWLLNDVTS